MIWCFRGSGFYRKLINCSEVFIKEQSCLVINLHLRSTQKTSKKNNFRVSEFIRFTQKKSLKIKQQFKTGGLTIIFHLFYHLCIYKIQFGWIWSPLLVSSCKLCLGIIPLNWIIVKKQNLTNKMVNLQQQQYWMGKEKKVK